MTHRPDFGGCWAKVGRANVHLSFLDEQIDSFINDGNLYEFDPLDDLQTGQIVIHGEGLREPPVEFWGAIIGDVVHNLRSALDHLVWQLTLANGYTPPATIPRKGTGSEWRDIRFPIYTVDPRERYRSSGRRIPWRNRWPGWSRKKIAGSLWGVRPDLRTVIQTLQPFNRRKNAAKEPLAILDELWNIDKHRHFHFAHFSVWLDDVRSVKPLAFAPEIKLRVVEKYSPRPLKGRTEIGRVEQVGKHRSPILNMYVHADIAYDVAFEQGPPAYGAGVIETFKSLHDTVAAIIVEFETKFP
jgi:hypothetical protein